MSEDELDRQLAWDVVWPRLVARYLTDQRRAACFAAHHAGARRHGAAGEPHPAARQADAQAAEIRGQIASGKTTFAAAARQYSQGPSREKDGRLGWIGRHGPMDESFSRAAFALQPGELSPPVRSPFGVHLIRCDEVRAGKKQLAEVRGDVDDLLARELFEKLVHLERQRVPVRYGGGVPHFKPGTRELEK